MFTLSFLWSIANTSFGRIGIAALAIVAGLWGVIWHAENKGIAIQVAKQEQIDTSAKSVADAARAEVRRQIAAEAAAAVAEESENGRVQVRDAVKAEAAYATVEATDKARATVQDAAKAAQAEQDALPQPVAPVAAPTSRPPHHKPAKKKPAKSPPNDGFRRD
jgi:FtsZ-interacting cell division protein ZipA